MSNNDNELPVAAMFLELVETSKTNELLAIEEQRKRDRQWHENNKLSAKSMNASEAFLGERDDDDKKKRQTIEQTLERISKESAEASTPKDKKDNDEAFPPPPIL